MFRNPIRHSISNPSAGSVLVANPQHQQQYPRSQSVSVPTSRQRTFSATFSRAFWNMYPQPTLMTGHDSLSQADLNKLFDFQLALPQPKRIIAATLYIMGVTDKERMAAKVVTKLTEIGVLSKYDDTLNTHAIGPTFTNQVYMLPKWALKRLVCILFAWEEELMRWRMLEEERQDLQAIIQEERREGGNVGHLEVRCFEIEGLWKLPPSMRDNGGRRRGVEEELPGYY